MADFIIIAVLAAAVFFILKDRAGKARRGECTGGCAGCRGCSGSCGKTQVQETGEMKS